MDIDRRSDFLNEGLKYLDKSAIGGIPALNDRVIRLSVICWTKGSIAIAKIRTTAPTSVIGSLKYVR